MAANTAAAVTAVLIIVEAGLPLISDRRGRQDQVAVGEGSHRDF
jgi:hypothetical protein